MMRNCFVWITILLVHGFAGFSQTFYRGNDLSYVNQMEDCGAVFKENGVPKDVYQIFADHGTNLVRMRLWVDPAWQNDLVQPAGVKLQYSDFEDVKETISRSKAAGMQVLLDFHLSDFWADPGKQLIPAKWLGVAYDVNALKDSVYNYVIQVLTDLNNDSLMPEMVQIGNETNGGILRHTTIDENYNVGGSVSSSWARHAQLFNSAIKAVRDINDSTTIKPKIALHCADPKNISWFFSNIISYGVTDFDIMGFSYYYAWHKKSIAELGSAVKSLKTTYPAYEVMVLETGYPWTTQNFDAYPNLITIPDPQYIPLFPEKQLEYMVDYTRAVMKNGGSGVIFWEPAWVSTPCKTPWGQGSSHDHLVLFDPVNVNFMDNGGGRWTEPQFYEDLNTVKVTFKVDMTGQDVSNGVYIAGDLAGDTAGIFPMADNGHGIYSYFTYLTPGDTGSYCFLNDSSLIAGETVPPECAIGGGTLRRFTVEESDKVYAYTWGTCYPPGIPETVKVTFVVDMTDQDISDGVWVTGTMTGDPWKIMAMTPVGNNLYSYSLNMHPGDSGAFYFMNDNVWGEREDVPAECSPWWGVDRGYKIGIKDTIYSYKWGSCESLGLTTLYRDKKMEAGEITSGIEIYPNPAYRKVFIQTSDCDPIKAVMIFNYSGKLIRTTNDNTLKPEVEISLADLAPGIYFYKVTTESNFVCKKIIKL